MRVLIPVTFAVLALVGMLVWHLVREVVELHRRHNEEKDPGDP